MCEQQGHSNLIFFYYTHTLNKHTPTYLSIATGPIVASTASMLGDVDILLIVELGVRGVENPMDDSGLQIQQDSSGYIVLIICLQRGHWSI
jgi:hypothetical protein